MAGKKIGFIGIGNMGWPMSANLVNSGHQLIVFDINHDQAARFANEHKATHAKTLQELGENCEAVITMLPNGKTVRSVMLEMESTGLVGSLAKHSLLIDMSSSDPIGTRELGADLKQYGISMIDAPVSGGVPGAKDASLTIMIGCDAKELVEKAKPILSSLGKRLFETGPLGSGHAMKALNNFLAAAGFEATSEALIVGERFGLDPAIMVDILNVSTGRNFSTETVMISDVLTGKFSVGFALALIAKDLEIAANLARGLDMDAPMIQLNNKRWGEALSGVEDKSDFTAAFRYWESTASGNS